MMPATLSAPSVPLRHCCCFCLSYNEPARSAAEVRSSTTGAAAATSAAAVKVTHPDWLELQNIEPAEVKLSGWKLTVLAPPTVVVVTAAGAAAELDGSQDDGGGSSTGQQHAEASVNKTAVWTFPNGASIPAGGYLLVWALGPSAAAAAHGGNGSGATAQLADAKSLAAAAADAKEKKRSRTQAPPPTPLVQGVAQVSSTLRLPSTPGSVLVLSRPDGSTASAVGISGRRGGGSDQSAAAGSAAAFPLPPQLPDVSFGTAAADAGTKITSTSAGDADATTATTYLVDPTPGAPNAGPVRLGPFVFGLSAGGSDIASAPPPGVDVVIRAVVAPNLNPVSDVYLQYVVGFKGQQQHRWWSRVRGAARSRQLSSPSTSTCGLLRVALDAVHLMACLKMP